MAVTNVMQREIVEVPYTMPDGRILTHMALVISRQELQEEEDGMFYAVLISSKNHHPEFTLEIKPEWLNKPLSKQSYFITHIVQTFNVEEVMTSYNNYVKKTYFKPILDKIEYIDQPQLFIARDDFDTMYLCLLYDDERYTAIRISATRLQRFESKQTDLLDLYTQPENKGEYFDVETCEDGTLSLSPLSKIDDDRLPAAGYYLQSPAHEKITITIPFVDKPLFSSVIRRFGWVAM